MQDLESRASRQRSGVHTQHHGRVHLNHFTHQTLEPLHCAPDMLRRLGRVGIVLFQDAQRQHMQHLVEHGLGSLVRNEAHAGCRMGLTQLDRPLDQISVQIVSCLFQCRTVPKVVDRVVHAFGQDGNQIELRLAHAVHLAQERQQLLTAETGYSRMALDRFAQFLHPGHQLR